MFRRFSVRLATLVSVVTLVASLGAVRATEYVVDLIEPQFLSVIADQLAQGNQLVDVEMQPVIGATDVRYSGVFAPIGGSINYILRVDSAAWDVWLADMAALDGRFLDFEVEVLNGEIVRSGLFWQSFAEDYDYAIDSSATESDFQALLEDNQDQGRVLIDFESYKTPTGDTRYGGLWVDGSVMPRTNVLYGMTLEEVEDLLDPLYGRVMDIERYSDEQGRVRWGVVLVAYAEGDSLFERGLDATALADVDAARSDQIVDIDTYESSPGVLTYNASWGDTWKSLREVDPLVPSTALDRGQDIDDIIAAFEANGAGEMGLFGRNVRLEQSVEYRPDEPFYLASSAKLAVHARLFQLDQQGHLDVDVDTLQYSDDPNTAIPWFVDERPDCGSTECGLSTGACNDGDDRAIVTSLRVLSRGMMIQSDNAATSMLVDDPTFGLALDDIDLNEWVSSLPGVGRGFGIVSSIQDLDRVIMWAGQFPNASDDPSYFGAPRAGLETVFRGGNLGYRECRNDSDQTWTGNPCGCSLGNPAVPRTTCPTGQTCTRRQDPWDDLIAYLQSVDPTWPDDGTTFPPINFNAGHARYYNSGLNWATPRAFGELQEQFIRGELHDEATLEDALGEMTNGDPLTQGRPAHIESYSKGGAKSGDSGPCSDTTMFRVGPDAVVVNVMTKNNQSSQPNPPGRSCAMIRNFWRSPPTASGTPLGLAVLQRLLPDLTTADPEVSAFSPATVRPGQPFEALVEITNVGQVATPVGFAVTFYAVVGNVVEEGTDDIGIGTVRVDPLAAGETVRVRLDTEFPSISDGTYSFGWVIDPNSASAPLGEVGEFDEDQNPSNGDSDNRGIRSGSVLTVLPAGPPCEDLDLDGYHACHPDCDARGLTCGDCDDDDGLVSPLGTEVCNQRDDDCDGVADPAAARPGAAKGIVDPDPRNSDELGRAVARLGDLNGDGIGEIAAGQPFFDDPTGVGNRGAVRVYDGATRALYCTVEDVAERNAEFGASVAGLEDVTGDDVPDFVVGAPLNDGVSGDEGIAYIINGATCTLDLTLTPTMPQSGERFGTAVAAAGDINLDGIPDVAVGAPFRTDVGTGGGAIDVFSGSNGALILTMTDPDGLNDAVGKAMTSPGDLDGDLVPDMVVGVPDYATFGAVLVFSGRTGDVLAIWERAGTGSSQVGFSVASLGDVTGDGVPDLAVGAPNSDTLAGDRVGDAQILSGADGSPVHTLSDLSGDTDDKFGHSVAAAGDLDGDGLVDVAVGAPFHDTANGADAGVVVVFSSATGAVLYDLEDAGGRAGDRLGWAMAGLDDLTGDSIVEFAVGAPRADGVEAFDSGKMLVWSMEADCDLDGSTPFVGDCDDQDGAVSPGAVEVCDTIDNDCDALVDEDDDGDSFAVCDDCDDTDARVFPGAVERCNGLDDDCDTEIDEGVDADLDGFTDVCDCDDGRASINPDALDTTCDRIDQDCNGVTDDGFDTPAGERLSSRDPGGSGDQLGISVAVIDDLNGDGLAEIVAGVPEDDANVGSAGSVAVFDGATGNLHCLMTDPDAVFFDFLGSSVAVPGDLTGDGVPDVIAGAKGDDDPEVNAGSVVVFSGADCTVAYKTFDPQGVANDELGTAVAAVGDQNGDGFSEYAASAPNGDDFGLTSSGRVVVFDGATGVVLYRVNNLAPAGSDRFGTSIAGGHDLDADGIPDFVVGTEDDRTRIGNLAGSVLVVSGADGTPIRKLVDDEGAFGDEMGRSVALIDDLDGDTVADILAGSPGSDTTGSVAGAVIVFSGADGNVIGRATFDTPGTQEYLGWSVAAMPDVDGDDVPDIAAGAPRDDDFAVDTGSVYLISGADLSLIQRVSRPEGQSRAEVGRAIAVAPDLTGDGMPEVVAGAPLHDGDAGGNIGLVVMFALEADCDGDGVSPFGGDCDDGDGSAFGRPGDVEAFAFDTQDTASWQPPSAPGGPVSGLMYDVLRSNDAADFTTETTCEESGDTDTTAFLPGLPGPGAVWFYVVRAGNACDVGPAGFDSDSLERPAQACP